MDSLPTAPEGIRACPGEPYSEDFFFKRYNRRETAGYLYRHKVLFNLYAMDSVHSNRTHSPTLNLYGCEFKYFIENEQALIQVETNNYSEMAVKVVDD